MNDAEKEPRKVFYRNWLKRRHEKKDEPSVYNQKDNQRGTQNEEKGHEPDLVKEALGASKIAEFARFIAGRYYDGRYTIERHPGCYHFRFGVGYGDGTCTSAEGKTVGDAVYRAVLFELPSEGRGVVSYEKVAELADDRLAIIQEERQKCRKLEDEIVVREKRYEEIIKEKDDRLIAKDVEYRKLMRENEDLAALSDDRLAAINEEKQKSRELEDNLASKEKEHTELMAEEKTGLDAWMDDTNEYAPSIDINKYDDFEIKSVFIALATADEIAKKKFDGHWTLMKFTTNYRFAFGTITADDLHPFTSGGGIDFETLEKIAPSSNNLLNAIYESIGIEKKKEDMKEILKKEDIKERMRNRAFELFSEGVGDEEIRKELIIFVPNISIDYIQRLRRRWEQKAKLEVKLEVTEEKAEETPLEKKRVLATIKGINILEPVWNDMQDTVIEDGKWHFFSEAEAVIKRHKKYQVRTESIKKERKSYFHFAKDKECHIARGRKDYRYEWRRAEDVNKYEFRFTTVKMHELEEREEAEPEKQVEEEIKPINLEEGVEEAMPLGKTIGRVKNTPIYENPWKEFETLFCDGNDHLYSEAYPEAVERFRKYEKYNQYKLSSLSSIRAEHIQWACKEGYQLEKDLDNNTFRFLLPKIKEKIEAEPAAIEKPAEIMYEDKGKLIINETTKKVRRSYNCEFHNNPLRDISTELNTHVSSIFTPSEIKEVITPSLKKYDVVTSNYYYGHLLYFVLDGLLKKEYMGKQIMYTRIKTNLVPKPKKKGFGILDRLEMIKHE